MLVIAASSFYRTQNEAVFRAESSELKIRQKEDFSLDKNENSYGENTLVKFFSDEKELSLKLNKQSLELLKSNFAETNFIDLGRGVIGLSGSAASFVDAWYKDISINRNFLRADLNADGKIEGNEFKLLKNSVKDFNENQDLRELKDAPTVVLREVTKTQGYMQSEIKDKALSLEELLNQAIISDKNLDGKITRLEYAAQGQSDEEGYKNWALEEVKDMGKIKAMIIDPNNTITPFFEGKSIYEIYNAFAKQSSTNAFEGIQENSKQIGVKGIKKGEKDEEKEKLLREFPDLKSIIQNNPNISKESLEKIREKKKIASAYSQEDLKTLFSKTLLSFEKRA